ncbi:DUF2339 domain-containing protein [Vibrio atypicus]|uniref:DUF2339 domain-containing protein n=1 Tax=Vibrio atypicus TaxID=558271 RepID=UPI00135C82F3|nr:DUF2339 domain-containing protein [Vibrio atypicus]
MEFITLVIGFAFIALVFVSPFMSYQAYKKVAKLEKRIRLLEREVEAPSAETPSIEQAPKVTEAPQPVISTTKEQLTSKPFKPTQPLVKPKLRVDIETNDWPDKCLRHLKENWLIWVGGLAMVIGAGYLIQVVSSNVTFTPIARITIATVLSASLFIVGEWLHRKIQSNDSHLLSKKADTYVPAVLYSTGMSGLYATICFSTIIYQILSPATALSCIALLAILCIALSLRLGPLMTALGLFGGYSAPLWIGGEAPNFLLLSVYITTISAVGVFIRKYIEVKWLLAAVSIGQIFWLTLISFEIPNEQILVWFTLFLPLSGYLLLFVPHLGWMLKRLTKPRLSQVYNYPILPALLLMFITFIIIIRGEALGTSNMLLFTLPAALLILPIINLKAAPRIFNSISLVVMVMIERITVSISEQVHEQSLAIVWIVSSAMVGLVGLRAIGQYMWGDRKRFSYWNALLSLPSMMIGGLLYLDQIYPQLLAYWSIFSLVLALIVVAFSQKLKVFTQEAVTIFHLVLIAISYCFLSAGFFTTAVALQVFIAVIQYRFNYLPPNLTTIKVMVSVLLARITLIPFVPALQATGFNESLTLLASFLPVITALILAAKVIQPLKPKMKLWLDAANLHIGTLLIFSQSNYLIAGSYNFITDFDFYSVSLFTVESLMLFAVYQLKAQRSERLMRVYQYSSYAMLGISLLLSCLLNTLYQPLFGLSVSGQAWPIFNWLAVGWLFAGLLAILLAKNVKLNAPLKPIYFYWAASAQIGLWAIYSIRQFWQPESMSLYQSTGMAELFSYTALLIIVGAIVTYWGAKRTHTQLQKVGLLILGIAVIKVFFSDTSTLEGIWRAVSMLALGGCLVGLGWLFQRLQSKSTSQQEQS